MALPNIGNPGDPPKRDGDLVNNSEGCPPPGEKKWTLKSVNFSVLPLEGGVVPITPYGGLHDSEVPLNNTKYSPPPVQDNDTAQKIYDFGKDTMSEIWNDLKSGDTKPVRNIFGTESTIGKFALAVAENPDAREALDDVGNIAEEGFKDLVEDFFGVLPGQLGARANLITGGAVAEFMFQYRQDFFTQVYSYSEGGGPKCKKSYVTGSVKVHTLFGWDGDLEGSLDAALRAGGIFHIYGGLQFDAYGEAGYYNGEWGAELGFEVSVVRF